MLASLIFILAWMPGTSSAAKVPSKPALTSGSEVISAINSYRTQNGLSQLTNNSLLTSLAQAQSDYQASIQTVTHTGPGGTSPQDRAAAAGYGGGNFFYLSEIIYGGYQAGVADAITWWQNSSLHNSIMLASRYTEIGAGISFSGDRVYFTAVLGGPTGSGSSDTGSGTSSENSTDSTDSSYAVIPIQKATPLADGSIIHTVQQGQTIWAIEAIYELEPGTLRELNDIPSYPYVFPGDELIVRPPGEIEGTPSPAPMDGAGQENQEKLLGTPFSYSSQIEAKPTGTITFIKPTRAAAVNQPVVGDSESSRMPTAKTTAIIALLILVAVLLGSLVMEKLKSAKEKSE